MNLNGNIPNYAANGTSNPLNNSVLLPPNSVAGVYGLTVAQTDTAHPATIDAECAAFFVQLTLLLTHKT